MFENDLFFYLARCNNKHAPWCHRWIRPSWVNKKHMPNPKNIPDSACNGVYSETCPKHPDVSEKKMEMRFEKKFVGSKNSLSKKVLPGHESTGAFPRIVNGTNKAVCH